MRGRLSIFSSQFKRQFNKAKYSQLTKQGDATLYNPKRILLIRNPVEYAIGTFVMSLMVIPSAVLNYYNADSYREFVGEGPYVATYSRWGSLISSEEHALNTKIIERGHAEHHLHEFMDSIRQARPHH